jgi:alpha-L-arabinofuranosidase
MGCERNADAVRMVSYAPLLAHVEGRTELAGAPPPWHGMIYFDGTRVFGTASYHLWKLFSRNRPGFSVKTDVTFPEAKPLTITGQIGVGTWDVTAEFKDVRVERGGTVVYESNIAAATNGWSSERGRWETSDGVYRQSRRGQGLSYYGEPDWTDYTLSLKARKLSGGEGFLIVFGRKGADKYWWNLGGWGNTQHAIEFNQTPVGRPVRGRIENDRWYDIKIALNGNRVRCYLDGELIHDTTATQPPIFFALAGREEGSRDVILKAINTSEQEVTAKLMLRGTGEVAGDAIVTVLESASLGDNNSLEDPTRLVPMESRIVNAGVEFSHHFSPRSLTVLRLKAH